MTNSLAELRPDIAAYWDCMPNGPLRHEDVTCVNNKKVCWVCEQGHKWLSPINKHVAGCNCPYCTGRIASPGETDLATVNPELLSQWHPTLNGTLTPEMVTAGSHKNVYWRCAEGHCWKARVCDRTRGYGCPYCDGKKVAEDTSLFTLRPDLAAEWHPTKNGTLSPHDVTPNSHKSVWWWCAKGHEWQAAVYSRLERGCPVCSNHLIVAGVNDLASNNPTLAAEWHTVLNGELTPEMVYVNTARRVWWDCFDCGHEWQARVSHRNAGSGCPMCSGRVVRPGQDLAALHPEIAAEWHTSRNGDKTPDIFCSSSSYNAWWQCPACGFEWQATIQHRVCRSQSCPACRERRLSVEKLI